MDKLLTVHRTKKLNPRPLSNPKYVGNLIGDGGVDYVHLCKLLSFVLFFSHENNTFHVWVICDNLMSLFILAVMKMKLYTVQDPITFCYLDMYEMTPQAQKYFFYPTDTAPTSISFFDYQDIRVRVENAMEKKNKLRLA